MELKTRRLKLRPLQMADAAEICDLIFSDPEVAKGLAHDISDPAARMPFAEGWCKDLGIDGETQIWADGGLGGFAITANSDEVGIKNQFLGLVGIYSADNSSGQWNGELFYALGQAFHGRRIMSEACAAVRDAFCGLSRPGDLYAVYWQILNPASGRILRRLGFRDAGTKALLDEHSADQVMSFHKFELWRLSKADGLGLLDTAKEAATKIGHLSREGLITKDQALSDLREVLSRLVAYEDVADDIEAAFDVGHNNAGFAYLRFSVT